MNNIESTYDCGICAARSFCLSACQPGSIMCMVNKMRTGQTKADEERYQTRPYRGRHIN